MYRKPSHIHIFDYASFVDTSQETLRNPHKGMLVEPAENPMLTWKMVALLTHLDGYIWLFYIATENDPCMSMIYDDLPIKIW